MKCVARKSVVFAVLSVSLLLPGCGSIGIGGRRVSPDGNIVAFQKGVHQVEEAISYYQTHLRGTTKSFPRLTEVEFDFKVGTEATMEGGLGLYFLTLGASAQKETLHEITYSYKHLPQPEASSDSRKPPDLLQELIDTIRTVAVAAEEAKTFKSPFESLKVQVEYGFKLGAKIGGEYPQLVTVGANAEYNRNTVQSVTLTFAPR